MKNNLLNVDIAYVAKVSSSWFVLSVSNEFSCRNLACRLRPWRLLMAHILIYTPLLVDSLYLCVALVWTSIQRSQSFITQTQWNIVLSWFIIISCMYELIVFSPYFSLYRLYRLSRFPFSLASFMVYLMYTLQTRLYTTNRAKIWREVLVCYIKQKLLRTEQARSYLICRPYQIISRPTQTISIKNPKKLTVT